jgi:hypothetical protein
MERELTLLEKEEFLNKIYTSDSMVHVKQSTPPHETYSDNKIQQAREMDMINFLENKEGFTFKQEGNQWRCIEHDSLVIMQDRMGWYWNSRQVGGGSAIDWCEKIYASKFQEAMRIIVGNGEVVQLNHQSTPAVKRERDFSLPEVTTDNRRVYSYLTKTRGIDPVIVNQLITDKKLYQDKRGNCVFVGFNQDNEPKYAGLRGTLSDKQFRGEVTGSDKRYGFQMDSNSSSQQNLERLYVFESPIEAMSHASIVNKIIGNDRAFSIHNRLSLGGVTDVALVQYLQDNPQIKHIDFCLNNDEAGRSATSEMMAKFEEQGYTVRDRPPTLDDFNDDLIENQSTENKIVVGRKR